MSIVADRERIAHDLHDHVIQQLFAGRHEPAGHDRPRTLTDGGHRPIRRTVDDLQDVVDDIRTTIYRLQRPVRGTHRRLSAADAQLIVAGLTADSPIKATLQMSGPLAVIGATLAGHAEAATREAVSNAVRHSGATSLHIEVTVSDRLVIAIIDNGRGISRRQSAAQWAGKPAPARRSRRRAMPDHHPTRRRNPRPLERPLWVVVARIGRKHGPGLVRAISPSPM